MADIYNEHNEIQTDYQYLNYFPCNVYIKIQNLSFRYGGPESRLILSNINIEIPPNTVTAIVGSSGSGKQH